MNIHQKLIEVRKTIKGFSKDTKGFNYSYVSGNQILRAIKNKMDELGILLIPEVDYDSLSWHKHEYTNVKGEDKLQPVHFLRVCNLQYNFHKCNLIDT